MGDVQFDSSSNMHCCWSVAIFAAREKAAELRTTIEAVVQAARKPMVIDVLINGNPQLAAEVSQWPKNVINLSSDTVLRVWSILLGGKAHAWNQYIHFVWPGSDVAFFIDGYVRVEKNSMQYLSSEMAKSPVAIAGTGVPGSGRTAAQLRERTVNEGALHGNFFALKSKVMLSFREKGFRLPLGLYGFDTLLGGVLGFGLDPAKNKWSPKEFILANPEVTWFHAEKKWWRYSDVITQFNRISNNSLRILVRKATQNFLERRKLPPELLPPTVKDFVLNWIKECPREAKLTLLASPLSWLALRKLRRHKDWSAADIPPKLIFTTTSLS